MFSRQKQGGAPRLFVWLRSVTAVLVFSLPLSGWADGTPFPLQTGANSIYFSAGEVTNSGALFFFQAPDLLSLSVSPALFFQTNTPLAGDLFLPVQPIGGASAQQFFFAASFPGRQASEFGDAEYVPSPPFPGMILFISGLPAVPLLPARITL